MVFRGLARLTFPKGIRYKRAQMTETAPHEKAVPTDAELKGELDALIAKEKRVKAGLVEIADRIAVLRKALNIKAD